MSVQPRPETYITKRGTPAKRITFQWTENKIATASKLWSEGATGPMIAERMGVSRGSVTAIASMHRDLFPSRLTKGTKSEDGRHLEVPEDWLQQASALWMEGSNANRIAELTGVRPSTAYTRIAARPDLFPEHRLPNPVRSRPGETRLGDEFVIYHVKRPHFTGEVHTMPRVSMLVREGA